MAKSVRLAVRAVILHQGRLLVVNAWPGGVSDLWCAPGGGVERGASLPDNLAREVHEECGLRIAVGAPCLINEFHDPRGSFHQVDIYFRATITAGTPDAAWRDPAGVVDQRRLVTEAELRALRFKPDTLPDLAFGAEGQAAQALYDPLEPIIR
ncbi:NUDIX hydrolase [Rhodobacteraceae bacterium 2376]|uniref:NUDIX hydrolase n=1 Tax=Rhabdonatronobacter sediminivivens TaxID=2743469 RepID=A0A7Z0HZ69_9RHOB|nr:NUDIX hydrolase [Rhabdonatronobacter sediminivivens]NYS24990.1 NUDIX hydrolase [Rhabdonatronobacter sediminivivens]